MKKFLASSLFLGLASISQATTINVSCSPTTAGAFGASGGTVQTCDTSALVGQTITGISIVYSFTALQNSANQGTITAGTFSFDAPGTTADLILTPWSGSGAVNTPASVDSAEFGLWQAGNSVLISNSFNGNAGTSGATFSETISVTTQDQTAQTPEPSTFIMLGSALTALGAFARRRKS